ncbi:MAG: hypothetical protein ABWX68_02515 [Arthrobacter sp.]|uniref:hypothetical protein n=1 Tax=Arthrobacter sp. TaxID=1667 RepID=UPI003484FBF7
MASETSGAARCSRLEQLPRRGRVLAVGYVENIRILPADRAPNFAASLVDAPAPPGGRRRPAPRVQLVWNGQRRVPGIAAGTRLRFEGMIADVDGVPTIYNPRYEILPGADEEAEQTT